jgi:hypothetical protein
MTNILFLVDHSCVTAQTRQLSTRTFTQSFEKHLFCQFSVEGTAQHSDLETFVFLEKSPCQVALPLIWYYQ